MIEPIDRIPRTPMTVIGRRMSVAVSGSGPTVVFVHGNATYSYCWRNIIPFLAPRHRCVAPDLLGMGKTDVVFPSGVASYSLSEQAQQLELMIELLEAPRPIVLVGHELGALLAIQYARKNPGSVAGLVFIEGVLRVTNDETFDPDLSEFHAAIRSDVGERMVLEENAIIEKYLPRLTARVLSPTEMDFYREPYLRAGESRRALLSLMRQLPLKSMPGPIDGLAGEARLWCAQSRIPKLVIGGNPGYLVPSQILGTAARWAATETASVRGLHFLMEDSPARLTSVLVDWLDSIGHA